MVDKSPPGCHAIIQALHELSLGQRGWFMELYDVMRTTCAAREFTDDPLPDTTLFSILEHARFAPSGGNRQAWSAIIVRDRTARRALAALNAPAATPHVAQRQATQSQSNP